jgi:flagellar basal-body rod protein FlgG
MSDALYIAASGANFQQGRLEVLAQNIAASDVAGYRELIMKGATNEFTQERRAGTVNAANGAILPNGLQKGTGVHQQATMSKNIAGKMVQTGNPYHVGIQGRGMFQIEMPNGEIAYTRDGTFTLNQDRTLVTQEGYTVSPAITIPANTTSVQINAAGDVFAKVAGTVEPVNVGTIQLATFANEEGLERIAGNLYLETAASGPSIVGNPSADDKGSLKQGLYEGSNVDATQAVIGLIGVQRSYEMDMKAIRAASEMMQALAQAA